MSDICKTSTVSAGSETTVYADSGVVSGLVVYTDGSNTATVLIKSGATTIVPAMVFPATPRVQAMEFPGDVSFDSLKVTVTGTGASALMFYTPTKLADRV